MADPPSNPAEDQPIERTRSLNPRHETPEPVRGADFRHGRFEPGQRLGSRYRIVGLLGKGGMGEVYRADDLELGQSVALKFLPERVAGDPSWLRRFRNEVRTARQVVHTNVCRIYDIGEEDEHIFLSMEYIDGEDLASVLRRMGRPSREKAIEIARQICLGLAAVHENKILHRDLKPANIMIDGRGRVRITDFGLAGFVEELENTTARAGTPAYMAPEQLADAKVSVRSDIYTLGLILHELFTARRVFDTNDVEELKQKRSSGALSTPTSITEEIDPVVERVILRCLDKEPDHRPQSVYQVLAALPGGDPLATSLAAGETPSPEMVAAAGPVGALSSTVASALLAAFIGFSLLTMWIAGRGNLLNRLQMDKPPAVLRDHAQSILRNFGYDTKPGYVASWFTVDNTLVRYVVEELSRSDSNFSFEDAKPPLIQFEIRTSPEQMVRLSWSGRVTRTLPPFDQPGMARLTLDGQGKLIRFAAVSDTDQNTSNNALATARSIDDFNLAAVFDAAGLDESSFTPTEPNFEPTVHCDILAAWRGHWPGAKDQPLDIHAGIRNGRLAYFRQNRTPPVNMIKDSESGAFNLIALVVVVIGLVFMFRNLRTGRGDRKGAFRLALFIFGVSMARWLFTADHSGFVKETDLLLRAFSVSCGLAVITWAMYLSAEPYARRFLPETLISWTRLLDGRFRDPRVGRDLLIGVVTGAGMYCSMVTMRIILKEQALYFPNFEVNVLSGGRFLLGELCSMVLMDMLIGFGLLVLLLIFRILLRNTFFAGAAFVLLIVTMNVLRFGPDLPNIIISFMLGVGVSYVAIRFGLLAAIAQIGAWEGFERFAATFDFSQWYSAQLLVGPAFILALALFGFWISLAGQPIIGDLFDNPRRPQPDLEQDRV